MNKETLLPLILPLVRHAITLAGGAVFLKQHDSEVTNYAGLAVSLLSMIYASWKEHQQAKLKEDLKTQVVQAKNETATIIASKTP